MKSSVSRLFNWRQWSVGAKLSVTMSILIALVVIVVALFSIQREQRAFRRELEQQAYLELQTLEVVSRNALLFLDVDFLEQVVEALSASNVLTEGRFYDDEGRLIADATTLEGLTFSFDYDDFAVQLLATNEVIYDWQDSQLLAGQAVIIGNQPAGAMVVGLSTELLSQKEAETRTQGAILGSAAVVVGILIALLISRNITNRLRDLTTATQAIADSNFAYRIPIQGGDELATLGNAFNQMAGQLQSTVEALEQQAKDLTVANTKLTEEMSQRQRAEYSLDRSAEDMDRQNRQLERVHEFVRFTLEQVTDSVRRGAASNELLETLNQAQFQFTRLENQRSKQEDNNT